jgi:hypothetical protein
LKQVFDNAVLFTGEGTKEELRARRSSILKGILDSRKAAFEKDGRAAFKPKVPAEFRAKLEEKRAERKAATENPLGFRIIKGDDPNVPTTFSSRAQQNLPQVGRSRRDDRSIGEILNTARRQRGAIQSARSFQSAFGAFGPDANRGPLARARQQEIAAILATIGDGGLATQFNENVERFREASRTGLAGFPSRQQRLLAVITDESLPIAAREKAVEFFRRNIAVASPKDRLKTSLAISREARRFGSPSREELANRSFKLIAQTGKEFASDPALFRKVTGLTDDDIELAKSIFQASQRGTQAASRN